MSLISHLDNPFQFLLSMILSLHVMSPNAARLFLSSVSLSPTFCLLPEAKVLVIYLSQEIGVIETKSSDWKNSFCALGGLFTLIISILLLRKFK